MIPQAVHRPRDFFHEFSTHEFATPPYKPQSQPRKPEHLTSLSYRNPRAFDSGSTYAVPNGTFHNQGVDPQRRGIASGVSYAHRVAGQYNDPAEHMLRRKTPNGTLAAGYDGTPINWSSKAPPSKQIVLPLTGSTSNQNGQDLAQASVDMRLQQQPRDMWRVEASPQSGNAYFDGDRLGNNGATSWGQPPFSGNPQNVLNHIHMQKASTQFAYDAMQIPTVLQPAYQPSPGPTASNDGGLYGPYWPDGKFEPYRPAAFREHAYMSPNPDPRQRTYRQHAQQSTGPLHNFRQQSFSVDQLHRARRPSFLMSDEPPIIPERPLDYRPQPHRTYSSSHTFSPGGSHIIDGEPQNRAHPAQFKDRTLSWAHSIYVDLLAFLHHSRKENRHSKQSSGSRYNSKHTIYPKPPRQPAAVFVASSSSSLGMPSHEIARRNTLGSVPNSNVPENVFGRWAGTGSLNDKRHMKFSISEVPHYLSPFQATNQRADSPLTRAGESLEMLSTLCEQSEWRWIDGMLLGGCLAYGLEEYHKALNWYSKIIALDPTHIEAISNLAATLLCLNRSEEAEQHWLQAVKLRPSYFEAVEHLIGLLCGAHRASEAVSIIEFVERSLRLPPPEDRHDYFSETSSNADRDSCDSTAASSETLAHDYEFDLDRNYRSPLARDDDCHSTSGFGSSGFAVPGCENGRMLALVHAKGNMLYSLGDIAGASKAFEDAVLISAGRGECGIQGLIRRIIGVLSHDGSLPSDSRQKQATLHTLPPLLLPPDKALQTARLVFTKNGELPGLRYVSEGLAKRAATSTTSNSLLSLAKIFQDSMSTTSPSQRIARVPTGVGDILALYYLSLSLQPSPSTANNVGILLASVQQPALHSPIVHKDSQALPSIPGVVPGSGVALALAYYNYGLNLDSRHAHLYTNLGSLLKDIGQLTAAIKMYEQAVACDASFDIALANLANAVKDQGRTSEAIAYYRRAVESSPDFAEAVCGLANALNSVCDWTGRGGVILDGGRQDRWHVDDSGMITEAKLNGTGGGWMKRVVEIVKRQLKDGSTWGRGGLQEQALRHILQQLEAADTGGRWPTEKADNMRTELAAWLGHRWEGTRVVRLVERAIKRSMHRWYVDKYVKNIHMPPSFYPRPQLPGSLSVPSAPTVLPFHTFTCPLSAKDIRMISQRNALRISCSTLRSPWMQGHVFPPPAPPRPCLNIGYVSSDFNNHPLAHLMQSVFGMHNQSRVKAFCYATTASDNSSHRQQIEREAPVFIDVSSWSTDRLVHQIVRDGIHILVNLNGYTRGARNEVFAARPAPIQMSFMGFAGTLGAEWCDYILADETAIPPDTLRPWRRNIDLEDQLLDQQSFEEEDWVYSENIIFCRDTFFCCDHAQSEPRESRLSWDEEQSRRWKMRKQLFPGLSDDAIILGNFNQLYKIEPTTFRTWLRILDKVPKAILWLLRFPDLGETNLKRTAREWAGESVASRIWFTDVAPKHQHISRARVCDLFLDTPECNAHTTAADVLWSSTPLLTLPRYRYKMCSRMAASILKGALPRSEEGRRAASELIAEDDDQYEEFAIRLAGGFSYRLNSAGYGEGVGRLGELRKLLYDSRWTCALFDTRRWVRDLEDAYDEAWRRWVVGEGGDIYL